MEKKYEEDLLERYNRRYPIIRGIANSIDDFKIEKYYNLVLDEEKDIMEEKDKYVYNEELKTQRSPRLILMNHSNRHDFPVIIKTLDKNCIVLTADTNLKGVAGIAINFNGCIPVNRDNEESCKKANEIIKNILLKGHDVLVMIEGTWNLGDVLPMLPFRWGTIQTAKELGVDILPIALEYDYPAKKCLVNIGKTININKDSSMKDAYNLVRDNMSTLRWNLWCMTSQATEHRMTKEEFDAYIDMIAKEYKGFDRKKEANYIYKPYPTWEEVIEPVDRLRRR